MKTSSASPKDQAVLEMAHRFGVLRTRDLEAGGLSRVALRRLVEGGLLISSGRGLYVAADADFTEHQTLAEVARRVPHGVICLLSALRFHEIGTQEPARIWLAIESGARAPRPGGVRLEVVRQSGAAWTEGVTTHQLPVGQALIPIRVTSPAKTVADCFKFRRRVGLDVALEALRDSLRSKKASYQELWRYAEIDRVSSVMKPYLEAISIS